ncbi:hypothetical protein F511_30232 [Dorcoceras hygrometricum]|uniref:Dystroglycan-like n=1 Tax=Dorcoceras hygrometricum TaxID=472368 RepID=A0A2Z7AUS4_9LAMI|nr:hypothetical protein F511_30232 [Dorcoceras hygrometricum]
MAASFYSNSVHVDFKSALAIDRYGIYVSSPYCIWLTGIFGCPAVFYEEALVEFFANGTVRNGLVVSTVNGVVVEISEKLFAETFDFPVDGLADISEMPKDKIFDARSIVSLTGEPVTLSGLKSQMKMHYRLLCDIMAKSIFVKAGSFNAITVEKFSLLTAVVCDVHMNWGRVLFGFLKKKVTPGTKQAKGFAIQISLLLESVPNLELGASSEFPSSKILTDKTIHRYIAVIDKSGAQEPADAPKVKKAPKTKVASRKRPADIPLDVPMELVALHPLLQLYAPLYSPDLVAMLPSLEPNLEPEYPSAIGGGATVATTTGTRKMGFTILGLFNLAYFDGEKTEVETWLYPVENSEAYGKSPSLLLVSFPPFPSACAAAQVSKCLSTA